MPIRCNPERFLLAMNGEVSAQEDLMNERWRPIEDAPGYEVSDLGRVRCWRARNAVARAPSEPRIVKGDTHRGYPRVRLGKHGPRRFVHQLVLEAFVGPCPAGFETRHVHDNTPGNVRLDNLAWGSKQENQADRVAHGTSNLGRKLGKHPNPPRGAAHGTATKPESFAKKMPAAKVLELRARYENGERKGLADEYGISYRTVWLIGTGRSRAAAGGSP